MIEFVRLFRSVGNASFDDHTQPHYDVTAGQLTFALIWAVCTFAWLFRFSGPENREPNRNHDGADRKEYVVDNEIKTKTEPTNTAHGNENEKHQEARGDIEKGALANNANGEKRDKSEIQKDMKVFTPVRPPVGTDDILKSVAIFGMIMFLFYLCDYRKIFPKLERVYNRDEFLFLVLLLFVVACSFTIKPTTDKILNRDQTEEWKGWMQVLFVWYHVFAAKEWYNWIRVYIAAYVWMTGFGNFSFFWVRKDFSIWRFLKMQFRLNFLVTCLCVVTNNQYMLYYICAMHSYWFISVYVFMFVLKSWNNNSRKMLIKFGAYIVVNYIIFEIPVVTNNVFKPIGFILNYNDPRFEPIHEWVFRAGLDHWACLFGMICAYNYPYYEKFIINLENSENKNRKILVKFLMVTFCVGILIGWYSIVMTKDKYSYNALHPYTSPIPILSFIIIRNSFAAWRTHYIGVFAWLGKITLETYLSQLHIYLQSNAKDLLGYIPNYHLLNFALATLIYLPVSYKLFNLTTDFSSYLLPNNMKLILKNTLMFAFTFFVPYICFTIYLWMYAT